MEELNIELFRKAICIGVDDMFINGLRSIDEWCQLPDLEVGAQNGKHDDPGTQGDQR